MRWNWVNIDFDAGEPNRSEAVIPPVLEPQRANSGTVPPLRAQEAHRSYGYQQMSGFVRWATRRGEKLCTLRAHHGPSAELLNELTQARRAANRPQACVPTV